MKTIQKLQVVFLIAGITGFFHGCQKEEQLKAPAKVLSDHSHTKSSEKPDILEYDKVISDMVEYGGFEISPEKIGLDLKEIPFQEYLDYRLFQTRTGLFLVLKYDDITSTAFKKAETECDKIYSKKTDNAGKVTEISCTGNGNSCCYFISRDVNGGQLSVRIITTA